MIIIEPGLIKTEFGNAAAGSLSDAEGGGGPYGAFNAAVGEATKGAYESGPMGKLGGGPEAVAKVIEKAITAGRPKTRYRVTPSAHLLIRQRSLMTDRMWDAMMRSQFPQPKASHSARLDALGGQQLDLAVEAAGVAADPAAGAQHAVARARRSGSGCSRARCPRRGAARRAGRVAMSR